MLTLIGLIFAAVLINGIREDWRRSAQIIEQENAAFRSLERHS